MSINFIIFKFYRVISKCWDFYRSIYIKWMLIKSIINFIKKIFFYY